MPICSHIRTAVMVTIAQIVYLGGGPGADAIMAFGPGILPRWVAHEFGKRLSAGLEETGEKVSVSASRVHVRKL
jgi:hypothetical protein